MKTYKREAYGNGKWIEVEIPVPTPRQFQATFEVTDAYDRQFKMMVSNLSYGEKERYSVCKFEPTTDPILLRCGIKYEVKAREINIIRDIKSREQALEMVLEFVSGRLGR